ncbi:hypothetical protein BH23ACT11_BH23ACT11_27010 [soil metagenome]
MFRVQLTTEDDLEAALTNLEEALRKGESVTEKFLGEFRASVNRGDSEVLVVYERGEAIGVAIVAYRLNVAAGSRFASVEELHVSLAARRRGVGRALLEMIGRRCRARGVSYVEVQAVDQTAQAFYESVGYEISEGVRVMSCSYAL